MNLIGPFADLDSGFVVFIGEDARHRCAVRDEMSQEAMLFEKALAIADRAGVALDKDAAMARRNHACRGERARTNGEDTGGGDVMRKMAEKGAYFFEGKRRPVRFNSGIRHRFPGAFGAAVLLISESSACIVVSSLKRVVDREPSCSGSTEVDEGVAETGTRVFPIALVDDVVSVEAKGEAALLAAGRVSRAEVEKVVTRDAYGVVARCFFAAAVAPAWHEMETGRRCRNFLMQRRRKQWCADAGC